MHMQKFVIIKQDTHLLKIEREKRYDYPTNEIDDFTIQRKVYSTNRHISGILGIQYKS